MSDQALLQRIQADPVWFCRDVLNFDPWSKQREVIESVRDNRRTAVRSGHGTGKSAIAARCVLWFLAAYPNSIVVTTSAGATSVREVLWRQIAVGFHASAGFYDGTLNDTRLELGPDHFALGLSVAEAEAIQGYHAPHLLAVIDEASALPSRVWEAVESLLTSPGSRLLAIGNPLRTSGPFFRAFTAERAQYNTIAISALESPPVTGEQVSQEAMRNLVGPAWIEDRRRAWGEGSPLWSVRVEGQFSQAGDDTVCSIADVEAAQARAVVGGDPIVVAADVARFGSDETVIVLRRGLKVRIVKAYQGHDLMRTVGEIVRVARQAVREWQSQVVIGVDDAGLGGGVTDRLRELRMPVRPFLGAGRPHNQEDFPNRRSEAWFAFAEMLPRIDLDPDEQLAADLVAPRYALDSQGRRAVEAKDKTKKRLGRSPDRADAVLIAFAVQRRFRQPVVAVALEGGPGVESAGLPGNEPWRSGGESLLTRPL